MRLDGQRTQITLILALLLFFLLGCNSSQTEVLELTGQGRKLVDAGRLDEAEAKLNRALELNPDHVDAILEKGRVYEERKDIKRAIEIYFSAVKTNPQHVSANMILGNAFRRNGKLEQAVQYVRKAADLAPGEGYIHHIFGLLLEQSGDLEAAQTQLERAAALQGDDAEFRLDLAKFYERHQKVTDAILQYKMVMQLTDGLARFKEWYDFSQNRIKVLEHS